MAIHRRGKTDLRRLWVTGIFALLILAGVESSKTRLKDPLFEKKVEAARLMQKSMEVIEEIKARHPHFSQR